MVKTITSISKKTISIVFSNIVLVITLVVGIYYTNINIEYKPKVIFFNVGQGDSMLILSSKGEKVLIDGGDGDYIVYKISKYLKPNDRVIDYVILTHPHQDHLSGLIDILERFEVKNIFFYPACYNSDLYEYFLSLDENIQAIKHDWIFETEDFVLKTLYPTESFDLSECLDYGNINNASIVLRLESEKVNILFTGDAEHEQEEILMNHYKFREIDSDILKAGHHCSRTASSKDFLNVIQPTYAICFVGEDNRFGHPHIEVIDNFNFLGIDYDLIFEVGDVVIEL